MARPKLDPDEATEIGLRLRAAREAVQALDPDVPHSQTGFADLFGVRPNTWNQWEQGRRPPDLSVMIRLADRFGIYMDWIYRGKIDGMRYTLADEIARRWRAGRSKT